MNNKLKIFCGFLLGIILGFSFSPIKHGINVRVCNNGNNGPKDEAQ